MAPPHVSLHTQAVARSENPESLELSESGPLLGVLRKALCWSQPERCAQVVYAMSGETLGSRFLEAVFWHTPAETVDRVFTNCLEGNLLEFAQHDVANFVVQTWLQRTTSAAQLKVAIEELGSSLKVRGDSPCFPLSATTLSLVV